MKLSITSATDTEWCINTKYTPTSGPCKVLKFWCPWNQNWNWKKEKKQFVEHRILRNWLLCDWNSVFQRKEEHSFGRNFPRGSLKPGTTHASILKNSLPRSKNASMMMWPSKKPAESAKKRTPKTSKLATHPKSRELSERLLCMVICCAPGCTRCNGKISVKG